MGKIKEIQSQLYKNPEEYNSVRFLIAKQIFAMSFTLYFLSYLFTVGGFYFGPLSIENLAIIRYHLYSLLVVSTIFFGYSLVEYWVAMYFPNKKFILIIVGLLGLILGIWIFVVHLGLLSSLKY